MPSKENVLVQTKPSSGHNSLSLSASWPIQIAFVFVRLIFKHERWKKFFITVSAFFKLGAVGVS